MLTKLFQRKTQSTSFIPEIDGLRFFAIITVIGYHINTAYARALGIDDLGMSLMGGERNTFSPAWWIIRLDLGVKVFFSISGMVLALPFIKSLMSGAYDVNLKDYYYRRLTRLEPPFILSLIGFYFVHILFMGEDSGIFLSHLSAGLFYLHQIIFGTPNPINPVTWSLETEAQFYLIIPAFFALFSIWKNNFVRTAFISIILISALYFKEFAYAGEIKWVQATVLYYLTNFMTGVFFAGLYLRFKSFFNQRGFAWDIMGLLSIFSLFYFYKPQYQIFNNICFNVATLGLMVGVFKGIVLNWIFTRPLIYVIGGMCYSIYLLHYAFLHLFTQLTSGISLGKGYLVDLSIQFIISLPVVLIISSLFYLLIEKPCMDKHWPRKFMTWISTPFQKNMA
jgi:peptidoglycan/LPS O-acetylase OafA/YrhL